MKISKNTISFNQLLDEKYGRKGDPKREKWESEYEAFRLGVLLEEARLKLGLSQEEVAKRCGTNKSYISRVENDATDMRMSTFMRIVQQGLGGHLEMSIDLGEG